MVDMPEPVIRMIKHPDTRKVMATVSPDGEPHMIVCGSLIVTEPDTIIVGEVFMYRACENLKNNPNVEFMVWQGREAYSIKAVAKSSVDSGPIFDKMAQQLDKMNMTLVAIWVFEAKEVWDESASKNAGSKVI
ncbi:MAG: pyridoxamine 5'-phosphate oxidase family protein [Candidatus Methanomethylophilaceae archaeon]|nr:pyridoxamine 5'-phosphate oxidase family protein [Candidatus Methanomethylophilaceae archaeon]